MAALTRTFLVRLVKGPAWVHDRPRRRQAGWDAHAVFMDRLATDGQIVLGGPVGAGDGEDVMLVMRATDAAAVRAALAPDPWAGTLLTVVDVEPWTVLLGDIGGRDPG